MDQKKLTLILAMLVLAVFAVGAVSAADNVTADIDEPASDIVIDDVPAVETDENEPVELEEVESESSSEDDSGLSAMTVVNFAPGVYRGTTINVQSNTIYNGNGATIYGTGSDDVFVVNNASNFVITGFNIIVNSTTKAAIYGANVFNAEITNNNISGGKDGLNIKETYDNLTITGNTITGFTRDGVSLVDHRTFTDLSGKGNSIISNNVITGISIASSEVGMFFGGNFKGTISGNVITKVKEGVEFTGKKAKTNGRLYATFHNNNISDIQIGIYMNNHNVDFFNITNCNIGLNSPNVTYAIYAPLNYVATGYVGVYNSNFNGTISTRFSTSVGTNQANNTGFP